MHYLVSNSTATKPREHVVITDANISSIFPSPVMTGLSETKLFTNAIRFIRRSRRKKVLRKAAFSHSFNDLMSRGILEGARFVVRLARYTDGVATDSEYT